MPHRPHRSRGGGRGLTCQPLTRAWRNRLHVRLFCCPSDRHAGSKPYRSAGSLDTRAQQLRCGTLPSQTYRDHGRRRCNSRRRIVPSSQVGRFAIRNRWRAHGAPSGPEAKLGVQRSSAARTWAALLSAALSVDHHPDPRNSSRRRETPERAGSAPPPETDEPTRPGACLALGVGQLVSPPNIFSCAPLRR